MLWASFPKLGNPINNPLQIGLLGCLFTSPELNDPKYIQEKLCECRVSVNRSGTEFLKIWLCLYSPLRLMDSLLQLLKNWASPLIWPLPDPRNPKVSLQLINSEALRVYCRKRQRKSSCKDGVSQKRLLSGHSLIMKMITKLYGSLTAIVSERRVEPSVLGLINELWRGPSGSQHLFSPSFPTKGKHFKITAVHIDSMTHARSWNGLRFNGDSGRNYHLKSAPKKRYSSMSMPELFF